MRLAVSATETSPEHLVDIGASPGTHQDHRRGEQKLCGWGGLDGIPGVAELGGWGFRRHTYASSARRHGLELTDSSPSAAVEWGRLGMGGAMSWPPGCYQPWAAASIFGCDP